MILFPNAKINIGLRILRKRPDGYHDVETLMYPIGWSDILEIVPAKGEETTLTVYGGNLADCPMEKNLVMKAYRAVERHVGHLAPVDIYLKKIVPDGAGLGGGSSDAAFTIIGLNKLLGLCLSTEKMARIASEIGADCPFFIYNRPMLATGTGTALKKSNLQLEGIEAILIAKPRTAAVSTKEAYAGVTPREMPEGVSLEASLSCGPAIWKEGAVVVNDFEESIFPIRPEVGALKEKMYVLGAVYAAMSGSGSAVFGLFDNAKMAEKALGMMDGCDVYLSPVGH